MKGREAQTSQPARAREPQKSPRCDCGWKLWDSLDFCGVGLEVLEKGVFQKPCLGCGDELCPRWQAASPAPNPPACVAALQIPWEASGLEFPASTSAFPPQMMNVLLLPLQPQTLVVVWMHKSAPRFPFPGVGLGLLWVPLLSQIPPMGMDLELSFPRGGHFTEPTAGRQLGNEIF